MVGLCPSHPGKEGIWELFHVCMCSSEEKSKWRLYRDSEVGRRVWEGKSLPERDRETADKVIKKIIASPLLSSDFLIYEVNKLRALSIFQNLDLCF